MLSPQEKVLCFTISRGGGIFLWDAPFPLLYDILLPKVIFFNFIRLIILAKADDFLFFIQIYCAAA